VLRENLLAYYYSTDTHKISTSQNTQFGEFFSYPITVEFSFPRKIKCNIPKLASKCKEKIPFLQQNPKFLINPLFRRRKRVFLQPQDQGRSVITTNKKRGKSKDLPLHELTFWSWPLLFAATQQKQTTQS
jgi:hypothetical protein